MDLGEVGWGDVDWIGLVQDMNRWRVIVNSVLNLRAPRMLGNYRVASRVVLSSIELVSKVNVGQFLRKKCFKGGFYGPNLGTLWTKVVLLIIYE
jgi:hypothetical protein